MEENGIIILQIHDYQSPKSSFIPVNMVIFNPPQNVLCLLNLSHLKNRIVPLWRVCCRTLRFAESHKQKTAETREPADNSEELLFSKFVGFHSTIDICLCSSLSIKIFAGIKISLNLSKLISVRSFSSCEKTSVHTLLI